MSGIGRSEPADHDLTQFVEIWDLVLRALVVEILLTKVVERIDSLPRHRYGFLVGSSGTRQKQDNEYCG